MTLSLSTVYLSIMYVSTFSLQQKDKTRVMIVQDVSIHELYHIYLIICASIATVKYQSTSWKPDKNRKYPEIN